MDYQALGNWLGHEQVFNGDEQLHFSDNSLWDWQCDYAVEASLLDPIPLQSLSPDPLLPCQDILQDFYTMCESENGLGDVTRDVSVSEKDLAFLGHGEGIKRQERKEMVVERCSGGGDREERAITFEEVSRYFYVPITQAAKELNVGLTQLKKKCRELGIPRWPHRKMKSLQALIKNVQELGREDGEMGEAQLRRAIEILEREKETMERAPGMQLEERTKRLRQACFKANFKKRRLCTAEGGRPLAPVAAALAQTVVKQQQEVEWEEEEEEEIMGTYHLPQPGPAAASACRKNTTSAVNNCVDEM